MRVHRTTGAHSFPNTLPRFFAFSLFFFFVVSFVAPTVSVVALGRTDPASGPCIVSKSAINRSSEELSSSWTTGTDGAPGPCWHAARAASSAASDSSGGCDKAQPTGRPCAGQCHNTLSPQNTWVVQTLHTASSQPACHGARFDTSDAGVMLHRAVDADERHDETRRCQHEAGKFVT